MVVIIIIFTAKAGYVINTGLEELTTHHSPTLITIQQMESDIMEGMMEAYTYTVLDEELEKEEFYEKSAHFDAAAQAYQAVAQLQDEEQEAELGAYNAVLEAKAAYFENAEKMINEIDRLGYVPTRSAIAVEASVNILTDALDVLVTIEKQELDEHVYELEGLVKKKMALLTILSLLLLLSMVVKPEMKTGKRKKKN